MERLLTKEELPIGFEYPLSFLTIVNQNLVDFDPWIILTEKRLRERLSGVKQRYPNRELVPFARREDNDDIACFENQKGVVIIHDFASEGYEGGKEVISFWDYFRLMVEDMIEYNS
ncbi:hypothetical protein [Algivirga pacifica]|uniref:SMI1/KNR4 family protein n=1 Tax=Algivirga pacifica TaxID=1162670 RepID=A0ABP9DGI6_9BACT